MQIGTLNRRLGFKEFKSIEIGTPVYEQGGYYYVWQENATGIECEMVRYYKHSLATAINFKP